MTHAFQSHLLNGFKKLNLLFFILLFASGCATTNRSKTLFFAAGIGLGSAAAGAMAAPKNERPEMHALYFGAIGAAVAAASGLFIFDEQKRSSELARENEVIKKALSAMRDDGSTEPTLLYETQAPIGKEIPVEYQSLVKRGGWSVYRLNQWVTQGENVLIHQDRMMKLIPPQLTPKSESGVVEGEESKIR